MIALLNAINDYFSGLKLMSEKEDDIQVIMDSTYGFIDNRIDDSLVEVLDVLPDSQNMLHALLVLSAISERIVNPVFSRSDAIGTLMRKKLEPVFEPIFEQIKQLTMTS